VAAVLAILTALQLPTSLSSGVLAIAVATGAATSARSSYAIRPETWMYDGVHPIAYEKAERSATEDPSNENGGNSTPILLLNGFGVGSFHQHRLIRQLMSQNGGGGSDDGTIDRRAGRRNTAATTTIYCIDYLGQGKSWPADCRDGSGPNEIGLRYCGRTWTNQIVAFIEQVVLGEEGGGDVMGMATRKKKVHIVGNSVGGHLAVFVAAMRPDLVESLVLLNPTPIWGLNLPFWSGTLPAPFLPKLIGRYLFDRIRDLRTIESFLQSVYANPSAFDQALMEEIRSCTELSDGGHAAFASILWSPPITVPIANGSSNDSTTSCIDSAARAAQQGKEVGFDECLRTLQCDVLLLFGAKDPWCKPAFAKRMLRDLSERPPNAAVHHRYVELSNVGHCPNHEAPMAVARVLSRWLGPHLSSSSANRSSDALQLVLRADGDGEIVEETWGETVVSERSEDEIQLSFVDRLATAIV